MTTPTVDVQGAAALLNVHPKTILDMIGAGTIPAARVGRAYVLLTRDVLAYVEQLIINQTAERLTAGGRRKSANGDHTPVARSQITPGRRAGRAQAR